MSDPQATAAQHEHDAGRFAALAAAAAPEDWERPSPVAGWNARDVVAHLVEWLPGFLERTGQTLPPVDVAADPLQAWRQRSADVQTLLAEHGDDEFTSPMFGTLTIADALDRFYVGDVWMHSWDLAKALGRDFDLGADRAADALEHMAQIDEQMLRGTGQFGPIVEVPATASVQDRFVGFIGRDPEWQPQG